jgi:hypothetical protein
MRKENMIFHYIVCRIRQFLLKGIISKSSLNHYLKSYLSKKIVLYISVLSNVGGARGMPLYSLEYP